MLYTHLTPNSKQYKNQLALIEWHQIVAIEYSQSSIKVKWPQMVSDKSTT